MKNPIGQFSLVAWLLLALAAPSWTEEAPQMTSEAAATEGSG